ncbi:MAG: M17 family peptidase N-terminal domain-containing protein, partial [Granulosicoccaceae bacterium]
MKFSLRTGKIADIKTDCILLPVNEKSKLNDSGEQIDQASSGLVSKLLARKELGEDNGATLLLQELPGVKATRTLLVRIAGDDAPTFRAALNAAAPTIMRPQHSDVQSTLCETDIKNLSLADRLEAEVQILRDHRYAFVSHKSKPAKQAGTKTYRLNAASIAAHKSALVSAQALADGVDLARELGNTSPNICHPKWLVTQARQMARKHSKLSVTVLDEKQMAKLGMGALLGVARGSAQPPRMIIFEYKGGAAKDKPLALVGKGV